ncbi:MAG: hypothetical protein ABUT20_14275 [Bacteroidota bacterium]
MPPATAFIFIRQLLLAFFCLLLIASNAQENNSSNENALSRWLDKKIDIDGKTTEWSENDFINDPKSGLSYIISNDTSSLYICLIATDEIIQTKF